MRRVAGLGGAIAALGCAAGCNAILGLDKQQPRPIDAQTTVPFHLDYLAVDSPGADPVARSIPGLTTVKAGVAGQPLVDFTVDDPGVVHLPIEFVDHTIRVQFKLPTETFTREVVMTATRDMHYPIPLAGKADRPAPPAGASISFSVVGGPSSFVAPRIYSTGAVWTAAAAAGTPPQANFTQAPVGTVPLAGSMTTINAADTDVWLVDYSSAIMPFAATGFGRSKVDTLPGSTSSVSPPPAWSTSPLVDAGIVIDNPGDGNSRDRLTDHLLGHVGVVASNNYAGGVVPSLKFPVSTKIADDLSPDDGVFIPLMASTSSSRFPMLVNPFPELPYVLRARSPASRALAGHTLTSGLQSYFPPTGLQVLHDVGLATAVSIQDATENNPLTLDGADFDTTVPLTQNAAKAVVVGFKLDYSTEACEVAAYSVDTTLMTLTELVSIDAKVDPTLQAPAVSVTFDPSPFNPSGLGAIRDYIIRITCRVGYLLDAFNAGHLDTVRYPVRTATNWTAAFHTMIK